MSENKDLDNKQDLDKIIDELNNTNRLLFEINKNIANLVLVYQVQLIAIEEAMHTAEAETNIPKKNYINLNKSVDFNTLLP